MNQNRNDQEAFRKRAEEEQNRSRLESEQKKIDYVNRAIEKMSGLRTKEAWKSFIFLRGELKKLMRAWQEQVNHPDTTENKRLYFLGCIYGAKVVFQISQNFVVMKKELATGNKASVLNFFKGGSK
jgi:hypothetical protein